MRVPRLLHKGRMHLAIQTREVVGGCQGDAQYRAETAPERSSSRRAVKTHCGPDWTVMRQEGGEATAEMKKTDGSRNGVVALGSDFQHTLRSIMHHLHRRFRSELQDVFGKSTELQASLDPSPP